MEQEDGFKEKNQESTGAIQIIGSYRIKTERKPRTRNLRTGRYFMERVVNRERSPNEVKKEKARNIWMP